MSATRPGALLGRWSEPEKLDLYTRWTLYLLSACAPLLLAVVVAGRPRDAAWAVPAAVLVLAHTAACLVVLRAGLGRFAGGPGPTWRSVAVMLALAGAAVAVLVGGASAWPARHLDARVLVVLVVTAATLGALSPLLRTRSLVQALLPVIGVLVLVRVGAGGGADVTSDVTRTLAVSLSAAAVVLSYRVSAWMVGVVWELDRARVAQARLAVAEERLRFSRDLHDVVGRALTAVAVKSELAAELASRGRDGAGTQMLEIRDLAHDTLREVRAVVEGYRSADLAAELVGARSVLRSAGVEVRVEGEDVAAGLGPRAAEALAWVVREGVTNVVRHSEARTCTLSLTAQEDDVVLRIVNDGARTAARSAGGAGLRGLAERLAPWGGAVTTTPDGARFVLEARMPAAELTEVAG